MAKVTKKKKQNITKAKIIKKQKEAKHERQMSLQALMRESKTTRPVHEAVKMYNGWTEDKTLSLREYLEKRDKWLKT